MTPDCRYMQQLVHVYVECIPGKYLATRSDVGEGPSLCLWGWPWPCRYFGASDFGCWVAGWPDASGVGRLAATVWCCSYFWGTSSR